LLSGTGIRYQFIGEKTVRMEMASRSAGTTENGDGTLLEPITLKGGRVFNGDAPSVVEIDQLAIEAAQATSLPQLLQKTPGVSSSGGVR
ncbi:hypothetical protein SB758_36880, partial [Burkholderia sp. SIMBA_013]